MRDAGPLAVAPAPPPSPASQRGESNFPIGKTTVHADRPPAPHPAFKSGRGVSSNLSPCRPRTPPPPPHPERETKGRARRVPPRGFHGGSGSQAGPPFGSPEKPPRGWEPGTKTPARGRGRRGRGRGKLWKKGGGLTMGGAERARIRGGCGPRGLAGQERERAARAVKGRRGRPRPPRGPPAPERCGARRGRTMAGASRAGWGAATGRTGGCRLRRLRGAGARLRGRRAGLYQAQGTRLRRGVAAAEPLRRAGERGAYQPRPRGGVAGAYQIGPGGARERVCGAGNSAIGRGHGPHAHEREGLRGRERNLRGRGWEATPEGDGAGNERRG